jgi:hypothetical protein
VGIDHRWCHRALGGCFRLDRKAEEIAAALDIPVIGSLPFDPAGAAVLSGGGRGIPGRSLSLLRAARGVADTLAARLPATVLGSAAQPSPQGSGPLPLAEGA